MVAADPHQGGATWAVLQYARGLEELGHEVWLVDPADAPDAAAGAYFAALELGPRAFLGRYEGPVPDVLLNVSGMLRDERVLGGARIRVYLDLDPVFNQLWHLQGVDAGLDGHTHYVTVGRRVPETGHDWISTLPPVVLDRNRQPFGEVATHDRRSLAERHVGQPLARDGGASRVVKCCSFSSSVASHVASRCSSTTSRSISRSIARPTAIGLRRRL